MEAANHKVTKLEHLLFVIHPARGELYMLE